jgi:hypothetical protein
MMEEEEEEDNSGCIWQEEREKESKTNIEREYTFACKNCKGDHN